MINVMKNGNSCKIEGILSEINLDDYQFMKDGVMSNAIRGNFKVRVDTKVNDVDTTLEIPIRVFVSQLKKDGTPNPCYEQIKALKDTYVSIAASDIERADRVRITGAQIEMNEYYKNGNLVSFPAISANFVSRVNKSECHPTAEFGVVFVVLKAGYEVDAEGVETDRYKITAGVPKFGGRMDTVPFYTSNPSVIDAVSQYWRVGDTVKATGRLYFTQSTETIEDTSGFGEPQVKTRTVNVSDLIITGGSTTPIEGDFAIAAEDVRAALAQHQEYLAQLKVKAEAKRNTPPAATPVSKNGFADLGF